MTQPLNIIKAGRKRVVVVSTILLLLGLADVTVQVISQIGSKGLHVDSWTFFFSLGALFCLFSKSYRQVRVLRFILGASATYLLAKSIPNFLMPLDLFAQIFKNSPTAISIEIFKGIFPIVVATWGFFQLSSPIVRSLNDNDNNHPRKWYRNFMSPILGSAYGLIHSVTAILLLTGSLSEQASLMAREANGPSFKYFVQHLNVSYFNGEKKVRASVVVYDQNQSKVHPINFQEN